MTNTGASASKRPLSTAENRRKLAFRNWIRPDKLEFPANANSPIINPPAIVVLDTPNNILATPSNILSASHIQARKSTATMRYSVEEGESNDVHVRFHFWWKNNSSPNSVSLANITSRFVINGLWEVSAACHPLVPNWNYIKLDSTAALHIVEFWNQPPTSLPAEDDQFAIVSHLEVEGGLCETTAPGQDKREYVLNKSYDVKHGSSFDVPPKGVALIEVALVTDTRILGGGPNLAIVNSFIVCPFVQFEVTHAIQSGPPI